MKEVMTFALTLALHRLTDPKYAYDFIPRRHVLRLMITAPLGYNVHICSTQPFVFGDEHSVMQNLTKVGISLIDFRKRIYSTSLKVYQCLYKVSNICYLYIVEVMFGILQVKSNV